MAYLRDALIISALTQLWATGYASGNWQEFGIRLVIGGVFWYLLNLFQFNATERRFRILQPQETINRH